jgi:hypothetical protein
MRAYNYITVRAPLWLSHSGAKCVIRKGCWRMVVSSQCGYILVALFESELKRVETGKVTITIPSSILANLMVVIPQTT